MKSNILNQWINFLALRVQLNAPVISVTVELMPLERKKQQQPNGRWAAITVVNFCKQ